ncbi:MAG: SPFH domain-containing protein [Planctomycetota bacterium]|jgi:hypothetical protein
MPEAEPTTQNPAPDRRRLLGWAALPGLIGGVVFGLSSLLTPSEGGAWQPAAVALVSLGALTLARRSELGREASPLRIRAALWFAPALVIASFLFTSTVTDLVESIRSALPLGAEELASAVGWRAGAAGVLALLLGLLAPYLAARDEAPLAAWYRTGAWLLILAGLEALAELADVSTSAFATTAEIVVGVTAVEVLTRAALASWQRFYDRVPHPGSTVAAKALTVRLLGSRRDPLTSLFGVLSDGFGVDLRGTYALVVVRRALGPVLLGLAVLGWLSTSLVSVPFDSVGVAERFGVRSPEPLEAGLHLLPPRPFGRVELVPDGAVESIDVGYRGARTDADRLWTVAHADQEYTLLLGDGLELLSINARLEYRISDPIAYVDSVQNPVATLTALAERELTRATVDRRLEDVLSENVERFGSDVAENVQSAADRRGLGIEVLGLDCTRRSRWPRTTRSSSLPRSSAIACSRPQRVTPNESASRPRATPPSRSSRPVPKRTNGWRGLEVTPRPSRVWPRPMRQHRTSTAPRPTSEPWNGPSKASPSTSSTRASKPTAVRSGSSNSPART